MDESENHLAAATTTTDPKVEVLQGELQSLRTLLTISLILVIAFSFCVNVFLFRQVAMARAQVTQAEQFVKDFNAGQVAEFWNKLTEFSKTHPEFAPIWAKYKDMINVHMIQSAAGAKGK